LKLTVSGVCPGATYYVKVAGAENTALGTGKYALTLNLGTGASPTVPLPNTQTANGNPISGSGGQAFTAPSSPGLIGGLLNLVTGLLKDGAGLFDLFETSTTNTVSHRPGCCCPVCSQALATNLSFVAAAGQDATNFTWERVFAPEMGNGTLEMPASKILSALPLTETGPTTQAGWLADSASWDGFLSSQQQPSASWSDACEACFADVS
jgi:hypothetical protein